MILKRYIKKTAESVNGLKFSQNTTSSSPKTPRKVTSFNMREIFIIISSKKIYQKRNSKLPPRQNLVLLNKPPMPSNHKQPH